MMEIEIYYVAVRNWREFINIENFSENNISENNIFIYFSNI
jgi:hypothetical protein